MNLQVVTGRREIQETLQRLKAATVPGRSNDGTRLMVVYEAYMKPTARAIEEASLAQEEGWDMQTYSGTLDRVFRNARGELVFTVLVLERTNGDGRHHAQ